MKKSAKKIAKKQKVKKQKGGIKKIVKKANKKKLFLWLVFIFFLIYFLMIFYHTNKNLPKGMGLEGEVYFVDEADVDFLYDLTYVNPNGEKIIEQEIFDKIFEMIGGAKEFILIDMFLFGRDDERGCRNLSIELSDSLIEKKKQNPNIKINFITDMFNTLYSSYVHPDLKRMEEQGINVILTDMDALRDSNPFYSALWRMFFKHFGLPPGHCKKSFIKLKGRNYCIRSGLKAINSKANHRKVVVADNYDENQNKKIVSLITSANPDTHGSDYSNVALYIRGGGIWKDIYQSEKAVAEYSHYDFLESDFENITNLEEINSDNSKKISLQLLTEGKIKKSLIKEIENTEKGDSIEMAMFLLTERDIIKSLLDAAERGVEIKIILDPSKYLFGKDSKGLPNRAVAREIVRTSRGKIKIKYYNSHGEEFHSKMTIIRKKDGTVIVFLGSANLTRRNIGNYNLEADIKLIATSDASVIQEILAYFDRIWDNKDAIYTVPYDFFEESSLITYFIYRVQEATGLCAF